MNYQELKLKCIETKMRLNQYITQAKDFKFRYTQTTSKLESLKTQALYLSNSQDVLKEIIDQMSQQHLQYISNLTTYALKTIFSDNISLEFQVGTARNHKTVEPILVKVTPEGIVRTSLLEVADDSSGGVQSVVGFVLQVYYIILNNLPPVLFLDEPFVQLSDEQHLNLLSFMKTLVQDKHFIFPVITHDNRIVSNSTKVYEVHKGTVKEVSNVSV